MPQLQSAQGCQLLKFSKVLCALTYSIFSTWLKHIHTRIYTYTCVSICMYSCTCNNLKTISAFSLQVFQHSTTMSMETIETKVFGSTLVLCHLHSQQHSKSFREHLGVKIWWAENIGYFFHCISKFYQANRRNFLAKLETNYHYKKHSFFLFNLGSLGFCKLMFFRHKKGGYFILLILLLLDNGSNDQNPNGIQSVITMSITTIM